MSQQSGELTAQHALYKSQRTESLRADWRARLEKERFERAARGTIQEELDEMRERIEALEAQIQELIGGEEDGEENAN